MVGPDTTFSLFVHNCLFVYTELKRKHKAKESINVGYLTAQELPEKP